MPIRNDEPGPGESFRELPVEPRNGEHAFAVAFHLGPIAAGRERAEPTRHARFREETLARINDRDESTHRMVGVEIRFIARHDVAQPRTVRLLQRVASAADVASYARPE